MARHGRRAGGGGGGGAAITAARDVLLAHPDRSSPAASEAVAALRGTLLPRPEYCAGAGGAVFGDLVVWASDASALAARGADGATAASTLAAILRATPADVGDRARRAAAKGLTRVLDRAADDGGDARAAAPLLTAAASLLARCGPDLAPWELDALHGAASRGALRRAWAAAPRDARARATLLLATAPPS